MSKGQIAMEYLVIVGFVAVITIPLVIIFQQQSQSTNAEIYSNEVHQISKRMADAAETVYYLGNPSKTTFKAYFPDNINSIQISNYEITFNLRSPNGDTQIVTYTPINVSGNLSEHQGVHYISVESREGYVWISG